MRHFPIRNKPRELDAPVIARLHPTALRGDGARTATYGDAVRPHPYRCSPPRTA